MPPPGQAQRAESKFIVFENFEKMNTQSIRQALSEKEVAWLENLQPIAGNNLTTVPGPNTAITSIAETINLQFYANLGSTDYIISFTSVGSGWATNIATAVSTRFAPPGTFTNPDMTTWQSKYVLINDSTAGYCFWDGTVFSKQGGVSPNLVLINGGSGYTSIPTVTISGGSGSGATATATIGTPQVNAVNLTSGGSQYSSAPAVVFTGGGGSGAAATAVIDPRGLTSLTLTNTGSYATIAPPLSVVFSGGGGSGAAASVTTAIINPPGFFVVSAITITNNGSGYTSAPTVTITGGNIGPFGHVATATCTVGNGAVTGVNLTSGGSGYTSAPSVALTGGGGSGAAATASVGGSFVTSLILTASGSGYLPSDSLTLTISGGGGVGATGTAHITPFATAGTTLAVFQGRVWLGGGRLLQYTGTGGFDDFNASNGAGSLTISDADLTHAITALRNYNNYLFIMGDQSVKQIGNISISGSTTLFTILTLSSDQGTIYANSCGSFNRVFMFLNPNGVYAVFGSSVQKISDDMDGIFKLIDFTQEPQSAIADINGIHHICWLVRYRDPGRIPGSTAGTRSILICFNGKKWFVISQGNALAAITTASTLASGRTQTMASSGNDITQILGNAATPVRFTIQTTLSHHGNAVQGKKLLAGGTAVTATGAGVINVSFDTENNSSARTYSLVNGFQLPSGNSGVEGSGRYLGATITGTLAGFTFTNISLEYQENKVWAMKNAAVST